MNLEQLQTERRRLRHQRHEEIEMVKREYDPKISALTLQIDREMEKGIKKRIRAVNTGRFRKDLRLARAGK